MTADDLRTRIAEVQAQHRAGEFRELCRTPYRWGCECRCNKRFRTLEDHEAHVADVLIQALGMQQEWGVTSSGVRLKAESLERAEEQAAYIVSHFWKKHEGVSGAAIAEPKPVVLSRYVTPWEPAP